MSCDKCKHEREENDKAFERAETFLAALKDIRAEAKAGLKINQPTTALEIIYAVADMLVDDD